MRTCQSLQKSASSIMLFQTSDIRNIAFFLFPLLETFSNKEKLL